ncbi:MAG: hypothetical protein AAF928_11560 [Myxococcota bacterium]
MEDVDTERRYPELQNAVVIAEVVGTDVEGAQRISGVAYDEAVRDAPTVTIEGRTVLIISRDALLANKRASGRPQISPTWPR